MPSALWWKDFEIGLGVVTVKKTGARVPLSPGVVGEFLTWVPFWLTIEAGRLKRREARARRIWFAPDRPRPWYLIWPVLQEAGIEIADSPADADMIFQFEDTERASRIAPGALPVFNGRCSSIEKSRVAAVFEDVFGYALAIDPENWSGEMVVKSEHNGTHDGRIVRGPIPREPGLVYQRLIDNALGNGQVEDLRCPTVGGQIPVVLRKRRSLTDRFANNNEDVLFDEPDQVFTPDERIKLGRFAEAMGLDWGGLDVLRDNQDGRLYVVDVNKTDMGPPIALPLDEKMRLIRRLARALNQLIEQTSQDS